MMRSPRREKNAVRFILPLLPLLLVGTGLPAAAEEPLPAAPAESDARLRVRLCRAETLAAVYATAGTDEVTAFSFAWIALCEEEAGKGSADELMKQMAERGHLEEELEKLSPADLRDLMAALETRAQEEEKGTKKASLSFSAIRQALLRLLANENAAAALAHADGTTSSGAGMSRPAAPAGTAAAKSLPSVWWLEHYSGSLLQNEPAMPAFLPPLSAGGAPLKKRAQKSSKTEEEELAEINAVPHAQAMTAGSASLSAAALSSLSGGGGGYAPAPLATAAEPPAETLDVEGGARQSVTTPTTVSSVTLGSDSWLYVAADALTLSGTMTVQNDSHLVVKDGGAVQLGTYSDSTSDPYANERVALLFNALLNSTTTQGNGVVRIDSVSVQFGDGNPSHSYNLVGADNVNATFGARYEIKQDLQLQNYVQGASKKPSLWKISESGEVHVKRDFFISSYQQMDVEGGTLIVDGVTTLGHKAGNTYAAKLTIADGSYVQLKQIGDARTQQDGKSELVMTGGELVFTADGNVVTNKLGSITLSGGELVADGHSWVLNHNATLGSDAGLTVRTDAEHSVTLGVAGTTTTLAGKVSVSEDSNAVLNGTYAGTGTVKLEDGATLTLGQNFSTAADSSVGLSGTGTVQVNWTGTLGSMDDGFTDDYHMNYTPSGLTGALNLEHAEGLVWQDAAGNTLHDVSYENGVLTGHLAADPTAYHIVTAGHQAKYDTDGNAEGANSFLLYNDGKLFIGENLSVSAAQVTLNGHTLTLEGSGRYDLGTIDKVQDIKLPSNLVLGDDWTGIIKLDGQGQDLGYSSASWTTWGMDGQGYRWDDMVRFDANGKALSWLELSGIKSFFNPDGESPYNHTIAANLILAEGNALTINNGFGGRTITFTGDIAGTGTFEHTPSANETHKFSGDISAWTGKFLKSAGGTAKVILSDNAHEVNAVIDRTGGTLDLSIETDTKLNANVTVNDLSITAGKTVEVGRDAVVDISSKTYDGSALAAFADAMSGAGEVHMKGNKFYYASGEHDIKTNFVFDSEVRLGDYATTWRVKADAPTAENPTPSVDGSITVQNGDFFLLKQQTLSIEGGAVNVEKGKIWLGTSGVGSGIEMSSGSLSTQGFLFNSPGNSTYTSYVSMTGGTLNITGNTFLSAGSPTPKNPVSLTGGTLLADNHVWTLNTNSTIGAVSVVTQGESGGITFGQQGITTTLTHVVDNRGNLTLDGTVNLTMKTSNTAYGFVDAQGHVNYSGVGFDAQITMPGEVYNVVSGNAAAMGSNLTWTANGQALTVVAEADKGSAPANALYFDGFNLRPVRDLENPEAERKGTIYHMGARGDYTMSAADAAIATGIELTGRGGALHVGTTPTNTVSLDLAAGQLVLVNGADLTVGEGQNWAMEAGASISLGEGSVLTLPGVWGETTPNSYTNSYSAYHLLHNTTGAGKVLFEGDVSWQFGNAGHNTVSTGGYNILDEYGAENGVNADIKFDLEVNGNMLIQNYRQGKDHPEVGSWWKVSEGGSLTVHGNFESSSYQKVSVDGGNVVVDGVYKIGHEAGREYEGDLELKKGSLTVGTLQTVHEDTSTVHISGGKLTVTGEDKKAFANTFREVSAKDAEFEGEWTWNHDATIGNLTITAGSAITLGTADTTLTLESPLAANNGALTLDGTIIVNAEATPGAWAYGTDELGYTPDGDGYYKRTDDLYTLIREGNDAELGANVSFVLNGKTLSADDFNWDGKAIGMGGTEAGTVYYLNTANGYTYTDSDTRTTSFELVNTGATLRLERDPASLETIHALGGTLSLGSGVRMESALLNAEATVTMAGEGTYLLSGNTLMAHPAEHHVSFGAPAWTGTVQMDGMLGTEGTLNDLGNENSWVEMQGVFGADDASTMEVNVKLTDTADSPAWIYTGDGHDVAVTGDWAGEGTFAFAPVGGAAQKLTYSGDLDAWTGTFSAQGGTAQLHFADKEHEVNAVMQQQGGRIELTADADTHFTKKTQAAVYEAARGDLTADHADAAAIESLRATEGNVTLKGLAADTTVELKELVIGNSHAVTALAAGGEAAAVVLGADSVLTAGQAATLTADLSVQSGSSLAIADRTQGLVLNGALSLGDGGNIQLDAAMKNTLATTGKLVLFSGVNELTLPDGTVITGALSALDNVEAERYFSGLLDRLNASGQKETYFLTYSGSADGGFLCIETPEPTITLLGLLALALPTCRRRRR